MIEKGQMSTRSSLSTAGERAIVATPSRPIHKLPDDTSLPLFVYGALKPGEISWPFIAPHVLSHSQAVVFSHALALVDSVPTAYKSPKSELHGFLVQLRSGQAYEKISDFENAPKNYSWQVVEVDGLPANILVARRNIKTRSDVINDWSASHDPYLSGVIPFSFEKLTHLKMLNHRGVGWDPEYIRDFLDLQSTYLLLWVLVERTMMFREGMPSDDQNLTSRIKDLDSNREWLTAVSLAKIQAQTGYRSASDPYRDEPFRFDEAFSGWYRVRNNIAHRGKGVQAEVGFLLQSTVDLHNTMAILLQSISPAIAADWARRNNSDLTKDLSVPQTTRLYKISL